MARMKMLIVAAMVVWSSAQVHATQEQKPDEDEQWLHCAMALFHSGLVAQDRAVIRAFLFAEGDPDLKLVDAQTERILAGLRFQRAVEVLPQQETAGLYERYRIPIHYETLTFAEWKIDGKRATGTSPELQELKFKVPSLINVQGVWKIHITPDAPAASRDALVAAVQRHARLLDEAAAGVEAGKIKTIAELERALQDVPKFKPSDYKPDLILALPAATKE